MPLFRRLLSQFNRADPPAYGNLTAQKNTLLPGINQDRLQNAEELKQALRLGGKGGFVKSLTADAMMPFSGNSSPYTQTFMASTL